MVEKTKATLVVEHRDSTVAECVLWLSEAKCG